MGTTELELDCTLTVNEVARRHPAALAVFSRFGIDTCCGGALAVADAAREHGIDPERLCADLRSTIGAG